MTKADRPKVLVLLGNTGARYAKTRHNVAWRLTSVPPFASHSGWQKKFKADWTQVSIEGHTIVVLLPQVMMNLSGESVQAAVRFFRCSVDEIGVVHDDVERPFGHSSIRLGGGLAGHNGLRSVASSLASREFWRVRIGVGRPIHGELQAHVLGRFSPDEEIELPRVINDVAELIVDGYRRGWHVASGSPDSRY